MEALQLQTRDAALWVTLNRPAQRNAINEALMRAMREAIEQAGNDRSLSAIVITGAGERAFCAGADLQGGDAFKFDYGTPSLPYANLLRAAHDSAIPLIARVNGACVAGGMGLLAMCDMAIASDQAVFGLPEVKVGLFPMQVLSVLQRILPSRSLYELCLTGEPIDAQEARQLGLVNYVVPQAELDAKMGWLLGRLQDKSPTAIRRGRYAMRRVESMAFEEAIAFTESQIGLMAMTDDAREGMQAFREKRKPVWR
ncbi:enoyl-CoA hydratase/isomerase family protein [Pusillimonas sp. SM2304]|uniref:enoyl-CoA hydratase/isomerase family protein n=1 Tax=Pusillimonas sp. SM2304 TaxID=3073241 RepID=UPI002874501E|nr:enoyl-CoA hydratase/isomerase family protein [Pusillimonas sp. SM2304]MDS1140024.1 enoyl-CoA hydratase/isomerase family protein [Pusillimonas sp. SM2304]